MNEPCRLRRGERYGACDDEGRVQGGSACSGVQRVKPFGPIGLMLASIRIGYCLTHFVYQALAASPLFLRNDFGRKGGKQLEVDTAQRTFRQTRDL